MQHERAMTKQRRWRKGWAYSAGERGANRVRAFDRGARGIYLEWFERAPIPTGRRKRIRKALGAIDRESAKAQTDEQALLLRKGERAKAGPLTLTKLFDMYEREVTPGKAAVTQAHDRRCFDMFLRAFGRNREPRTLSRLDWDSFIRERRSGRLAPKGTGVKREVRNRIIQQDLQLLRAALNWATQTGDGRGSYMLDRNPLAGLDMPREESPRRPVASADQYACLLTAARSIGPRAELLAVLAHETGRRGSSIRQLRWSDADVERRLLRWRGDSDKIGLEHETPLTETAATLLTRERARQSAIGDARGCSLPSEATGAAACPLTRPRTSGSAW